MNPVLKRSSTQSLAPSWLPWQCSSTGRAGAARLRQRLSTLRPQALELLLPSFGRKGGEFVTVHTNLSSSPHFSFLSVECGRRSLMIAHQNTVIALMFVPMAIIIAYMDVRYRRIPNKLVLVTLLVGLTVNTIFGGTHGLLVSLGGTALAFGLMFFLHVFGTMGAGDVKLFAAIGAINGISLVLPTLLVVALTGGVLA